MEAVLAQGIASELMVPVVAFIAQHAAVADAAAGLPTLTPRSCS